MTKRKNIPSQSNVLQVLDLAIAWMEWQEEWEPMLTAFVEWIRDLAARKRTSAMKQKSSLHFIK
jgi:hypothetical protein